VVNKPSIQFKPRLIVTQEEREIVWVPNTPPSLQTAFAAESNLAEGQFLLQKQILNTRKVSDIPSRNSKMKSLQTRKT
jgi:hypothetical protein